MKKIVSLEKFKKSKQKNLKMLFFIITLGILSGLVAWKYLVDDIAYLDVQIPESKNITYNSENPLAMTTAQIANEFEKYDGKPILLYIYTSWCGICKKNFATFNEIAREFQNTELHVIALAIDRNLNEESLAVELNQHGDLYFQPRILAFKEGFIELLRKREINYQGRIPFTVLIGRDGKVVAKYVGIKSKSYLRNKIIHEIY